MKGFREGSEKTIRTSSCRIPLLSTLLQVVGYCCCDAGTPTRLCRGPTFVDVESLQQLHSVALSTEDFILVFNASCGLRDLNSFLEYLWDTPRTVRLSRFDGSTSKAALDSLESFEESLRQAASLTNFLFVLLWNIDQEDVFPKFESLSLELDNVKWLYFDSSERLHRVAPKLLCSTIVINMNAGGENSVLSFPDPLIGDCLGDRKEMDLRFLKQTGTSLTDCFSFNENFQGKILNFGVFQVKPYLELQPNCTPAQGFFLHTLNTMAHFLNFSTKLFCTDKKFGRIDESGNSWTGLVGLIQRKEVHFIMPLMPTIERMELIDFSFPVIFDVIEFVTKKQRESSRTFALVQPYSLEVWAAIGLSVLVTSWIISGLSEVQKRNRRNQSQRVLTFGNAAWYLFASLTNQGGSVTLPETGPVSLALSAWWLYTLIVVSGYSGTLISFLNAPRLEKPIDDLDTLAKLIDAGEYVAGSSMGTSIQDYLQNEKEGSTYYKIGRVAREAPNKSKVAGFDQGMWRVLQEDYALVATHGVLMAAAIPYGVDHFHFADERLSVAATSLGLPKGSPLRSPFDSILLKIHQAGLMDQWLNNYFEQYRALNDSCLVPEAEKEARRLRERPCKPLNLTELLGVGLIWLVGLFVSCLAFLAEKLYKRRIRSQNR